MEYEKAQRIETPPMLICLHCRWYTLKRHYCCKDWKNPIRKVTNPACFRFTISDDARRAYLTEPKNRTEAWAQDMLRAKFRKEAARANEA